MTHFEKPSIQGLALALVACIIWSGNFVIARGVHDWMPPITLAFWRWALATLFIATIAFPKIRKQWPLIKQNLRTFIPIGIFGVGTFNTLVYIAAHHTSTSNIALIASTSPVWIVIFSALLKHDKLSSFKMIGTAIAFIGAVLAITKGDLSALFQLSIGQGEVIVLIAAWIFALYHLLLKYKPDAIDDSVFLFFIFAVGTATLAPFYLWELTYVAPTPFTWNAWIIYLYVSVFASVVAWFTWNKAVRLMGPVRTSLTYYTTPVFSSIMAIILLGESLESYHIQSFLLVFFGITFSNIKRLSWAKGDGAIPD